MSKRLRIFLAVAFFLLLAFVALLSQTTGGGGGTTGTNGFSLQFQNGGVTIFFGRKFAAVNCSTGLTCTYSSGVITMTAGGSVGTITGTLPGQGIVGGAVSGGANTAAYIDASVLSGLSGVNDMCDKIAKAGTLATAAGIVVIDARGFSGTNTCTPATSTEIYWSGAGTISGSTANNWPTGGVLMLGGVTLKLGSANNTATVSNVVCTFISIPIGGTCTVTVGTQTGNYPHWWQGAYVTFANLGTATFLEGGPVANGIGGAGGACTATGAVTCMAGYRLQPGTTDTSLVVAVTATQLANSNYTSAADTGQASELGTPALEIPNKAKIVGTGAINTTITADSAGCSNIPTVNANCTNWGVRFATISSAAISGTGGQCAGTTCWVNLTLVAGGQTGLGMVPPFQSGELVQVRSLTTAAVDNNWGAFTVCNHGKPANNGNCPVATGALNHPDATHVMFYTRWAVNTSNGGTVLAGTPLVSFGLGAVLEGNNGSAAAIDAAQIQVEKLSVDCNDAPGCISIQNVSAEEESYISWVSAKGSNFAGWDNHNGGASGGSNGGPWLGNQIITGSLIHCDYDTLAMYAGDSFVRPYIGMTIVNNPSGCNYPASGSPWSGPAAPSSNAKFLNGVGGTACTSGASSPNGLECKPQTAVMYDQSTGGNVYENFHIEGWFDGFLIGANRPSPGVRIDGFLGHSSLQECVHVSNNFSNLGAAQNQGTNWTDDITISRIGSGTNGCPTATIKDDILGITDLDVVTGLYVWDRAGQTDVNGTGTWTNLQTDPRIIMLLGGPVQTRQLQRNLTSFSTSTTTPGTAITSLTWTTPVNEPALSPWTMHCTIPFSLAVGAATVDIAVQTTTTAPTNMQASAKIDVTASPEASTFGGTTITTITAGQVVDTAAVTAIGTQLLAELWLTGEFPVSAGTGTGTGFAGSAQTTINILMGTSANTITVARDAAYCEEW